MDAVTGEPSNGEGETARRDATNVCNRASVLELVRRPFATRCNVVKVWRPLPAYIWTALCEPQDHREGIGHERRAVILVALMSAMLLGVFSSAGVNTEIEGQNLCVALLGNPASPVLSVGPSTLWCYRPGASLSLVLWVVVPSLAGWGSMRLLWIPTLAAGRDSRLATLTFARHLSSVYLYVFLMVVVGAALMPLFILAAPRATALLRWWLWCFLFGESFFVPAVMWIRLIIHDRAGAVFGQRRILGLCLYVLLFVVIPIVGMVGELD